jgi:hypothetical protein
MESKCTRSVNLYVSQHTITGTLYLHLNQINLEGGGEREGVGVGSRYE